MANILSPIFVFLLVSQLDWGYLIIYYFQAFIYWLGKRLLGYIHKEKGTGKDYKKIFTINRKETRLLVYIHNK